MQTMQCEGGRHGMCQPRVEVCDCSCHSIRCTEALIDTMGAWTICLLLAELAPAAGKAWLTRIRARLWEEVPKLLQAVISERRRTPEEA